MFIAGSTVAGVGTGILAVRKVKERADCTEDLRVEHAPGACNITNKGPLHIGA